MRTLAIIAKEFLHIRRDIRILYFALIWPVVLLLLFGYTVSYDVKNLPVTFFDLNQKSESRELYNSYRQTGIFSIVLKNDFSWAKSLSLLDKGKAKAVAIIPSDFSKKLNRLEPTSYQFLVDGSDNNTAQILIGYAAGITQDFNQKQLVKNTQRYGSSVPTLKPPIDYRTRFLYNPTLKSQNFIVTGLIAIIMMNIGTLLTSLAISIEWERGTMEQLLYTPIRAREFIIGKLTPYFIISLVQVTMVLLISIFVFKVPFRGNILLFYLAATLFLLGALGIGLFISLVSKTQQVASQFSSLVSFLPTFLLSGFIFPVASMPIILRSLSYLVPATYFLKIMRGLFLKGAGLNILGFDFLIMFIFAAFFIFISTRKFSKRIT
jgi:ABC-2 type transport system permease protein